MGGGGATPPLTQELATEARRVFTQQGITQFLIKTRNLDESRAENLTPLNSTEDLVDCNTFDVPTSQGGGGGDTCCDNEDNFDDRVQRWNGGVEVLDNCGVDGNKLCALPSGVDGGKPGVESSSKDDILVGEEEGGLTRLKEGVNNDVDVEQ